MFSQKKAFLIFSKKKNFLIFSQKKVFLDFQKLNPAPFSWRLKNKKYDPEKISYTWGQDFLHFGKWKPRIFFYILGKGIFLYNGKGILRSLIYSEPCHNEKHLQNPRILRIQGIARTLSNIYDIIFCKNSYLVQLLIFPEMKIS